MIIRIRRKTYAIGESPVLLSDPEFTANVYCICLSIDVRYTQADAVQICGYFWDTQYLGLIQKVGKVKNFQVWVFLRTTEARVKEPQNWKLKGTLPTNF